MPPAKPLTDSETIYLKTAVAKSREFFGAELAHREISLPLVNCFFVEALGAFNKGIMEQDEIALFDALSQIMGISLATAKYIEQESVEILWRHKSLQEDGSSFDPITGAYIQEEKEVEPTKEDASAVPA